jgi:hypothetical protein
MLMLGPTCFGHHYAHHQAAHDDSVGYHIGRLSSCCWLEVKYRQDGWVSGPKAVTVTKTMHGPVHVKFARALYLFFSSQYFASFDLIAVSLQTGLLYDLVVGRIVYRSPDTRSWVSFERPRD